jgi:hypothetical protein
MKMAVSSMWLSESAGGVVELPFSGPQCAASAASSPQTLRSVLTMFESWRVIAIATVADGGVRQSKARTLRQPSRRKGTGTIDVVARGSSAISGFCTRRVCREAVIASHNNSLEPTPVTKARFVWFSSGAAQLNR